MTAIRQQGQPPAIEARERSDHQDQIEHNYQMWLIPDRTPTNFGYHQLQFADYERQGCLRLYVSPDGRDGSMPINTDAFIYSGRFKGGDRLSHALTPHRGVWLQVVHGALQVAGHDLSAGDGIGITQTAQLDVSFIDHSEILLFDLGLNAPRIW